MATFNYTVANGNRNLDLGGLTGNYPLQTRSDYDFGGTSRYWAIIKAGDIINLDVENSAFPSNNIGSVNAQATSNPDPVTSIPTTTVANPRPYSYTVPSSITDYYTKWWFFTAGTTASVGNSATVEILMLPTTLNTSVSSPIARNTAGTITINMPTGLSTLLSGESLHWRITTPGSNVTVNASYFNSTFGWVTSPVNGSTVSITPTASCPVATYAIRLYHLNTLTDPGGYGGDGTFLDETTFSVTAFDDTFDTEIQIGSYTSSIPYDFSGSSINIPYTNGGANSQYRILYDNGGSGGWYDTQNNASNTFVLSNPDGSSGIYEIPQVPGTTWEYYFEGRPLTGGSGTWYPVSLTGIASNRISITRQAAPTATGPDPFSFTPRTVPVNTLASSSLTSALSGISNGPVSASVTSGPGTISKDGANFSTSLTGLDNGSMIYIRATSSSTVGQTVNTQVNVNGVSATYTVTAASGSSIEIPPPTVTPTYGLEIFNSSGTSAILSPGARFTNFQKNGTVTVPANTTSSWILAPNVHDPSIAAVLLLLDNAIYYLVVEVETSSTNGGQFRIVNGSGVSLSISYVVVRYG